VRDSAFVWMQVLADTAGSMSKAPRFDSYSQKELVRIEQRIDRNKFPERHRAVREEIARCEKEPPDVWAKRAWRSKARRAFHTFFIAVWCGGAMAFAAQTWISGHASPRPTPTHSRLMSSVKKTNSRPLYITPGQEAVERWLRLFFFPGVPLVLGIGCWLHYFRGVRIWDNSEPRER